MVGPSFLDLPDRARKPRDRGLTHVFDDGVPLGLARDVLSMSAQWIDVWKLGFGIAYLDPGLAAKLAGLAEHQVRACLGGTLLEVAWLQGKVSELLAWAEHAGVPLVEVSNGATGMPGTEKRRLIEAAADRFTVLAEVGSKDPGAPVNADAWAKEATADLEAGARWVIAEGRESGTVGLYQANGSPRDDVVRALLEVLAPAALIFEAPRKAQQAWFIRRLGPDVSLANIPVSGVLGLEALRVGLRADTVGQ
ncbi:MAG TPA: phosphosulfolactate synthase [Jiangellaceae bacterium]|nr:phosphosulfolactate synthase [Jiangellaceae bacterium]